MPDVIRRAIGVTGHRIADFDTQAGVTGAFVRWCWRVCYGNTINAMETSDRITLRK